MGPTHSYSHRQNRKSVLLEMVLPFCIACDFLNCGPELVHTHMYRPSWGLGVSWDHACGCGFSALLYMAFPPRFSMDSFVDI